MDTDISKIRNKLTIALGKPPPVMFLMPVEQIKHVQKDKDDWYEITIRLIAGNRAFDTITVTPKSVLRPDICLRFGNKGVHLPDNEEWEVMQRVFNTLLRDTPERTIYHNVGMNETGDEYILGTIRIRSNIVDEVENALIRQPINFDKSAAPELCFTRVIDCFRNRIEGIICFLTMLLSFTLSSLEKMTDVRPSFVLLLIGRSGSFKTAFAQGAFGFYGGATVSSFRDSKSAIVETIKSVDDIVCLIDDFSDYLCREQNEKLEEITRLQGDRTSVRKVMIGGRVDNRSVNSLSVVTGENFPKAQPSSIARMAILDVNDSIVSEGLSKLQESQPQYIGSLIKFIQCLVKDKNAVKRLLDRFKSYRSDLTRSGNTPAWHPRYSDMFAWLASAWDMWSEYCNAQAVSLAEFGDVKSALFEFIMQQHRKYLQSDVISVFFDTIGMLIANGKLSVVDMSKLGPDNLKPRFDVIYDGNEIHYDSQTVFATVSEHCFRNGISFQTSAGKFYKRLAEEGLLKPRQGFRNTGEFRKRCIRESTICVYRNRLLRYLNKTGGDDCDGLCT